MAEPVYRKVIDGAGQVSFVEVPQGSPASAAIDVAGNWLKARSGETSTKLGAAVGIAAAPTLTDYATKAVIAGLAGDYVSCALYGVPALVGGFGALAAIITPENPKGPTDEEIHAAVVRLSHDQLISLLAQPVNAKPVPTTAGSV